MIIKTALVAALIVGSASMALAATHYQAQGQSFHSRDVALPYSYGSARESWMDRASRNYSGGGY
jgi:opacity protein-like surface antigen